MLIRFILLAAVLAAAVVDARSQWAQTAGPEGAVVLAVATEGERIVALIHNDVCEYVDGRWVVRGTIDGMYGTGGDRLAMYDGTLLANTRAGIIRSSDGGATWAPTGVDGEIYRTNDGFFVLSGTTVLHSESGLSWRTLGSIPDASGSPVYHNGTIYTSEFYGSRVFRSDDGAKTWHAVELDLPLFGREAVAGAGVQLFSGGNELYAVVGSREILVSGDGIRWLNITHDLPEYAIIQNVVGNSDDLVIDVNTHGLYRLGAGSWHRIDAPTATSIRSSSAGVIVNTFSGIHRIPRGSTSAVSLSRGLVRGPAFAMGSIGDIVLTSAGDGIHRTTDGGDSWARVADFGSWQLGGFVENRGVLYTVDGVLYQSLDSGATWQMTGPKFEFEWEGPPYRTDITGMDASNGIVYVGVGTYLTGKGADGWSSGGMFRSSDDGATWTDISSGLPNDGMFSYAPTGTVIASGDNVLITNAVGVYRSTNRGASWTHAMRGLPRNDQYIGHGELFDLGSMIALRLGTKYFTSRDGGASWSPMQPTMPAGFEYLGVNSIIDGKLYTQATLRINDTTYTRRLLEFDGAAWNDVSAMQPSGVEFGSFVRAGGFLYAGSTAHGVWRMQKSIVVNPSGTDADESMAGMTLESYPNPVSGAGTLRITLNKPASAHVTLVNMLGETVATLHDGALDAGQHVRHIDLGGIAAGVYILKLTVPDRGTVATTVSVR